MTKAILALLIIVGNCYAVEKLESEGQIRARILSAETIEVNEANGTAIYGQYGEILQIVL